MAVLALLKQEHGTSSWASKNLDSEPSGREKKAVNFGGYQLSIGGVTG